LRHSSFVSFLNATASGAAAFAARYNAARSSSITDSCRSAQIINSFGEVAFAQLKLAQRNDWQPARSATAHTIQIRVFDIDVCP